MPNKAQKQKQALKESSWTISNRTESTKWKQNSDLQQCNVHNILHPQKLTRLAKKKKMWSKTKENLINKTDPEMTNRFSRTRSHKKILQTYSRIEGKHKNNERNGNYQYKKGTK